MRVRASYEGVPAAGCNTGPTGSLWLWLFACRTTHHHTLGAVASRYTHSAAEIFALTMRRHPHCITIGRPTGGCLSDILCVKLPNGWRLGLSYQRYHEAETERCYEGVGIPPDILLDRVSAAEQTSGGVARDSWLDDALQTLPTVQLKTTAWRRESVAAACAVFGVRDRFAWLCFSIYSNMARVLWPNKWLCTVNNWHRWGWSQRLCHADHGCES